MEKQKLKQLLVEMEQSTHLTNVEVQEAFNKLAMFLFTLNFKYQDKNFQIAEIEFASSKLKDVFHENPLQLTLGRTYVHKAKNVQNYAGFDITCGKSGSEGSYGTLLIRAIRFNGEYIYRPNHSLRAILGISSGKEKKSPDELEKFKAFNNLDIFEEFQITKYVDSKDVRETFKIGERVSIVGKGLETKEEKSGALLRATILPNPIAKKKLLSIDEITDAVEEIETEPFVDIVSEEIEKEGDYKIGELRYNSLIDRTFLKKLEAFLYIKVFVQKEETLTFESFKMFNFTAEYEEQMANDYRNVSVLRAKNKIFTDLKKKYKSLYKEIKGHIRTDFENHLKKDLFLKEFFFKDHDKSKRICGYCGVSEEEISSLFEKSKIYTKRQYSRGQTLEVDKIDPNDYYRMGNIVLACYWCNNAKTDEFTEAEFKLIGKAIKSVWDSRLKITRGQPS